MPRVDLDLPKGRKVQLELYLGHLPHHILAGQPHVDAGGFDVPISQLLPMPRTDTFLPHLPSGIKLLGVEDWVTRLVGDVAA